MALQRFDELNTLRSYAEIWYNNSSMPDKAKKKRINLCMDFTELMLLLFYMITEQELENTEYVPFLAERLSIIASNYIGTDNLAYVNDWSQKQAKRIVDSTLEMFDEELEDISAEAEEQATEQDHKKKEQNKSEQEETQEKSDSIHFEEFDVDISKKEYSTSGFRACLIAIECVTSVANYDDYYQAYKDGRHKKVWMCGFYKASRKTHKEAHGQETEINKPFHVGDSVLSFPGDITNNPDMKEIYGCECWCEYY